MIHIYPTSQLTYIEKIQIFQFHIDQKFNMHNWFEKTLFFPNLIDWSKFQKIIKIFYCISFCDLLTSKNLNPWEKN